MICIYQLNFSKSSYIGQTTNLKVRLAAHLKEYNCGPKLKQAWAEETYMGHTVLEECTVEELDEKEMYWINLRKPNLNTTAGGKSNRGLSAPRNTLSKEEVEEIVRLLVEGKSTYISIATLMDLDYQKVRDVCIGKSHVWATEHIKTPLKDFVKRNIKLYDSNNNLISVPERGEGLAEWEKANGLPSSGVKTCLEEGSCRGWSTTPWPLFKITEPCGRVSIFLEPIAIEYLSNLPPHARSQLRRKGRWKGWKYGEYRP